MQDYEDIPTCYRLVAAAMPEHMSLTGITSFTLQGSVLADDHLAVSPRGEYQSLHRCIDLVSQGVIPPVPLALRRCTTRLGALWALGRGGSSALLTHLCSLVLATPDRVHLSAFSS